MAVTEPELTPGEMRLHGIPMFLLGDNPQKLKEILYPDQADLSWEQLHDWKRRIGDPLTR